MDRVSSETRSRVMSSVRSKDTRLELFFRRKLREAGLGPFSFHCADLPGRPDVVSRDARIAIFVDSCFWHGCRQHLRRPRSHQEYWRAKIRRNRGRDREVTRELREDGWVVLRIWSHSLENPRALKWWLTRIGNLLSRVHARGASNRTR